MKFTHRGFDPAWLSSSAVRLELVAVVNRIDRRVFHPGTCGELRFVYRAAYQAPDKDWFSSRLPLTVNVGSSCPTTASAARDARVRWPGPTTSPLSCARDLTLKSVLKATCRRALAVGARPISAATPNTCCARCLGRAAQPIARAARKHPRRRPLVARQGPARGAARMDRDARELAPARRSDRDRAGRVSRRSIVSVTPRGFRAGRTRVSQVVPADFADCRSTRASHAPRKRSCAGSTI